MALSLDKHTGGTFIRVAVYYLLDLIIKYATWELLRTVCNQFLLGPPAYIHTVRLFTVTITLN